MAIPDSARGSGDESYDVIVVGGGGSGLAAAIEAARAGARVILFEKAEQPGGTTAWSVGSYTTSGTRHQRRSGINDTALAHFQDMDKVNARPLASGYTDNLELRRILTENSPTTFQWLTDLGIEFVGPNEEPPHSVPRMHNVVPSAAAFPHYLVRECRRLGVRVECGRRLVDLIIDNSRARGVIVEAVDGSRQSCTASCGIVLACGDFAASRKLRTRFFGPAVVEAAPINAFNTGDGIRIGENYGGRILNGGHANSPRMRFVPAPPTWVQRIPPSRFIAKLIQFCWNWVPQRIMRPFVMQFLTTALGPEATLFKCGAILIGPDAANIPVDLGSLAFHLAQQSDNKGYIVFDSAIAAKLEQWPNFISTAPGIAYAYLRDYRSARRDIYREAATIAELARKIGVDAKQLQAVIAAENAKRQRETPVGPLISEPPFYSLGPVRAYVTMTEGGLRVDRELRVIGDGNEAIKGLYAAGSTGQGGLLLEGHGHHISWAFVSGRIAGRNAALAHVNQTSN